MEVQVHWIELTEKDGYPIRIRVDTIVALKPRIEDGNDSGCEVCTNPCWFQVTESADAVLSMCGGVLA